MLNRFENGGRFEASRLGKALISLAGVAALLVLTEVLLSQFGEKLAPTVIRVKNGGYQLIPNMRRVHFSAESHRLIRSRTNSYGALDKEWPIDAIGKLPVIVVIGNSFVAAAQTYYERRFTDLLERRFLDDGRKVIVMNFGINGQNIVNYLDHARYLKRTLNPDLTIIAISNDSNYSHDRQTTFFADKRIDYLVRKGNFEKTETPLGPWEKMQRDLKAVARQSWLVRAAHNSYTSVKANVPAILNRRANASCKIALRSDDPYSQRAFLLTHGILREINRILQNKLVVLQVPSEVQIKRADNGLVCAWDQPEIKLKNFSDREGFELVQLLELFRRPNERTHYPGGHVTDAGHVIIADALYRRIKPLLPPR